MMNIPRQQPFAMNKTILQDNNVLPSYPQALLNPYNRHTMLSPEAPVFTPNGVLTTTPYKTIKKDYGMEYARMREPINTKVTEQLTQTKRNRQPVLITEYKEKDSVIKDTITETLEINPEETRFVPKYDKNFLNTPDAVELKYNIDPSKELVTRNKQPFNHVISEFNNMLPSFMRNQETNTKRTTMDLTPKKPACQTTKEGFTSSTYSRNEAYKNMWDYNQQEQPDFMNKFNHDENEGFMYFDYGRTEEVKPKNVERFEQKQSLTDRYELYSTEPESIVNNDDIEEYGYNIDSKPISNVVPMKYKREKFQGATNYSTSIDNYLSVLTSQATAILCFVKQNKDFKPWEKYWCYLDKNLHKQGNKILFNQLKTSDADVAYVQNKGERMMFRIRDNMRFVPISVFTYVLIHEMAHLANGEEWGHGPRFQQLMHLLEVAGFEIGIIKPEKYSSTPYTSGGVNILTKDSIKEELYDGINVIMENGGHEKFYTDMKNKIASL